VDTSGAEHAVRVMLTDATRECLEAVKAEAMRYVDGVPDSEPDEDEPGAEPGGDTKL
jgi:hypothetical protein